MSAIAFDSLKYAKNLQKAGFSIEQSEALAHENIVLLEKNVATKKDLKEVENKLEHEISSAKNELRQEILELKSDLSKWYIGSVFVQIGLVVALIKLL